MISARRQSSAKAASSSTSATLRPSGNMPTQPIRSQALASTAACGSSRASPSALSHCSTVKRLGRRPMIVNAPIAAAHRHGIARRRDSDVERRAAYRAVKPDERQRHRRQPQQRRAPDDRREHGEGETDDRPRREGVEVQRRAGQRADAARHPQHEADAQPEIMPDEGVAAERIEQSADERTGHGEQFDQRQRQRIADEDVRIDLVKVIGHEGGRRYRRAEGGEEQGGRPVAEEPSQIRSGARRGADARPARSSRSRAA